MKTCVEEVAPSVSNLFGERWPALASIHPEKSIFADVDQFSALLTGAKNAFDILEADLDKSGSQESGEIADSTALNSASTTRERASSIICTSGCAGKNRI